MTLQFLYFFNVRLHVIAARTIFLLQATQLVGVANVPDDSDSDDDGPVVDMDEYEEEDDPVSFY